MPSPQRLLREYGLKPKRSWGQNFLSDANAIDRIIAACELTESDRVVVEVGPGTGALTEHLLAGGRTVIAVEHDRDMAALLRDQYADNANLKIVEADFLLYDLAEAAKQAGAPIKVIGNIPYQISAPLMLKLIAERSHVCSAHFLTQKEVALRVAAKVGAPDYSLLSVQVAHVADCEIATHVRRTCFYPVPNVDSSVVVIRFREDARDMSMDDAFARFVRACFHKRRKRLANSLRQQTFYSLSAEKLAALTEHFPDDMAARAEKLDVSRYELMLDFLENA